MIENAQITPGANRRRLAQAVSLVLVLLFFGAVELVCRLVERPRRLDRILAVLKEDQLLIWKQRAHLDEVFFGGRVHTDSMGLRRTVGAAIDTPAAKRYRVLVLGASPSFGWGVEDGETYASRLQTLLDREFPGETQVINGSGIGYSSFQGLAFLQRYLAELKPDLVTVSYVINDVDTYRFFRSDGREDVELAPPPRWQIAARNLLARSALCRLLGRALDHLKQSRAARARRSIGRDVLRPGKTRVSADDYRRNLERFASLVRGAGAQILFVKFPVNLPLGPEARSEAEAARLLAAAEPLLTSGDCAGARPLLERAAEENPLASIAHYHLGQCALRAGDEAAAERQHQAVQQAENHRCARDARRYNRIMDEVAAAQGVPLVDIVSAFARHTEHYLYVDPKLDTYHPNAYGHAIMGDEIYAVAGPIIAARLRGVKR